MSIDGLKLNSHTRQVWKNEVLLDVTSIEFDILDLLVRSAGRNVSRDELTSTIHQRESTPFERSLDVHISHLRKKLENCDRVWIRTVRGVVRYLLRDRDGIFGAEFVRQVKAMGINQVLSAPRSPWQRAYLERVIGTIRRECLDHVIVFGERTLQRHLRAFIEYYHHSRTHLALEKDTPEPRPAQPASTGRIVAIPVIGGLHHRYERRAA